MKRVFRIQMDGTADELATVTCEAIEEALACEGCAVDFSTVSVSEVLPKTAAADGPPTTVVEAAGRYMKGRERKT